MKNKISTLILTGAMAILAPFTQAGLQDLNNGLINDTELGIMWLKDANLADSEGFGVGGIGAGGKMNKATADAYINAINEANYLGFSDWRLPAIKPQNGSSYVNDSSFDGTGDSIYNIGLPGTVNAGSKQSELGHLYYTSLGGTGTIDTDGGDNPDCCLDNPGPFENLALDVYWSGNVATQGNSWTFDMACGAQCHATNTESHFVWPVRDAQVSAVPSTSVWAIYLLAGMLSIAGVVALRLRRSVNRSL